MTFILWLTSQADRNCPIGDLACDVIRDIAIGAKIPATPSALKIYITSRGGSSAAQLAVDDAYSEWKSHDKNRNPAR